MQANDAALKAHDRDPSTLLTHRTGSLKHRGEEFDRQDNLTHELLTAPARAAVDPDLYLSQ